MNIGKQTNTCTFAQCNRNIILYFKFRLDQNQPLTCLYKIYNVFSNYFHRLDLIFVRDDWTFVRLI